MRGAYLGDIKDERIVLGHGAGGRKMHRLIARVFLRHFGNPILRRLEDAALLPASGRRLAMTTDSYVVQPLFFPGGDIGKLSVCGTVNDLAVMGARPRYLSVGMVLREGVEVSVLERICSSMAATARQAGVQIVAGDTKVIERYADEGVYVNTTGIGLIEAKRALGPESVRPGDVLLVNGPIGEHEAAIALARGLYGFRSRIQSDCAPLWGLVRKLLAAGGVRMMRDPTRGGVATTLTEFADATGLGFVVEEELLPVSRGVRAVAELLGLDPLYMANEGKVVVVASAEKGGNLVRAMRSDAHGRLGTLIGRVVKKPEGAWVQTRLGSLRRLIMLEGEQLPRIC